MWRVFAPVGTPSSPIFSDLHRKEAGVICLNEWIRGFVVHGDGGQHGVAHRWQAARAIVDRTRAREAMAPALLPANILQCRAQSLEQLPPVPPYPRLWGTGPRPMCGCARTAGVWPLTCFGTPRRSGGASLPSVRCNGSRGPQPPATRCRSLFPADSAGAICCVSPAKRRTGGEHAVSYLERGPAGPATSIQHP